MTIVFHFIFFLIFLLRQCLYPYGPPWNPELYIIMLSLQNDFHFKDDNSNRHVKVVLFFFFFFFFVLFFGSLFENSMNLCT